ncbi:hypothetical protein DFH09DRAFT_1343670 [Mycena vulgaris]|nr:hypothetical protein DFH09DRAFT_1343670 [Mycena vulgaris]
MPPAPPKNQSSSTLTPPLHQDAGSHICRHILAIDANIRHKRRSPVTEMVQGERYKNMDYIFWAAFSARDKTPLQLTISYDIACQLRCCSDHLAYHPGAGDSTQSSGVDVPDDDDLPALVKVENDDDDA